MTTTSTRTAGTGRWPAPAPGRYSPAVPVNAPITAPTVLVPLPSGPAAAEPEDSPPTVRLALSRLVHRAGPPHPAEPTAFEVPPATRAPGLELLGEYEGSGFQQAQFIVRRADEQVVQLSRLLYLVLSAVDGTQTNPQIAAAVTEQLGRPVSAANIEYLLERKLAPLGLVVGGTPALATGAPAAVPACGHRPVLSVAAHRILVPAGAVNRIAGVLRFLFIPLVVTEMLHLLIAADWWLFTHADLGVALRSVADDAGNLFAVLAVTVASMLFHEFGHAAACRYGGGRPGHIGAGIYVVWPALYTNVTDAYRLDRAGRVRTDLGGVYFNVVFILGLTGVWLATGWPPLVAAILMGHLEIFQQLMPALRLDGYFIVGDLVGVPDLFAYMGPVMRGLLPGRRGPDKAAELTRRARLIVRSWVLMTVALITVNLVSLVVNLPAILLVLRLSLERHLVRAAAAVDAHSVPALLNEAIAIFVLCVPVVGTVILLLRTLRALVLPLLRPCSVAQRRPGRHLNR